MKYRVTFFTGAAVGYVFGTKAGRERYEQIKRASKKLADNPRVQDAAGKLQVKASELAVTAKDKAGEMAGAAKDKAGVVADHLPGRSQSEEEPESPLGTSVYEDTTPR
jgi:hypothetical protein